MIEKAIPLNRLARDLGVSVSALRSLVSRGIIHAIELPGGEIAMPESQTPNIITRDMFDDLRGIPITVTEAAAKYRVNRRTIINWTKIKTKCGTLIQVLKPGYRMEINEADIAYCSTVYHQLKSKRGSRIFDDEGNPYTLKHPWLADYRKQKDRKDRLL
jgi:predicted site-specific integrase-resolvase